MDKNRGLLQLENIGYVIDNKTILDKVQFDLSAGEFKLITGPSGCGKARYLRSSLHYFPYLRANYLQWQ